ncbi:serine protease [Uliginosibacterium sp. H3]|uniref:Serine protease n=1 Tax=Uliginosibacterium silvisoli TaxID=3114758 RepID=A0ABU6K5W1_9RHOO|nr:serine protease [Uliginosibacterium sp. H3]
MLQGILLVLVACALLAGNTTVNAALPDTLQRIKPSVVVVGTFQRTRSPAFMFLGTGFVVGDGSLIATNAHVKLTQPLNTEQLETLVVSVPSKGGAGEVREVTRLAIDERHDLALLKLKSGPGLPALGFSTTEVREGQAVAFTGFPIGNVLGLYPTTHSGVISAVAPTGVPRPNANRLDGPLIRQLADSFPIYQLDAIAYPGSSGSPLFEPETGQVIGIINSGLVRSAREAGLSNPTGITYAIPVVHLLNLMNEQRGVTR